MKIIDTQLITKMGEYNNDTGVNIHSYLFDIIIKDNDEEIKTNVIFSIHPYYFLKSDNENNKFLFISTSDEYNDENIKQLMINSIKEKYTTEQLKTLIN